MGALARPQLARALVLSGDSVKAKSVYNDLLTLWKNTDPGLPMVEEARAEYARLRQQESANATPSSTLVPRRAVAHDAQHRPLRRPAGPGDERAVREGGNRRIRTGTIGHRCA